MKLKTKRSAAKRFKITGTGKIQKRSSHHSHILTKKDAKRKRGLKKWSGIAKADVSRVKRMLKIG